MFLDYEPFHRHGTDPAVHRAGASFVLVGRDSECARIDELFEGAVAGERITGRPRPVAPSHWRGPAASPPPGWGEPPAPEGNRAR
jgi:hypothetical protein